MARANLNKIENFETDTTAASKYRPIFEVPESASIEMPPFRPHFINFSKTVFTYFEMLTFRGTFTK